MFYFRKVTTIICFVSLSQILFSQENENIKGNIFPLKIGLEYMNVLSPNIGMYWKQNPDKAGYSFLYAETSIGSYYAKSFFIKPAIKIGGVPYSVSGIGITTNIEVAYCSNFNNSQSFVLRPEIGVTLGGFLDISYGYNFSDSIEKIHLSRNSIIVSFRWKDLNYLFSDH